MNNDNRFDLDLKFGQEVECCFKRAVEGTVEVKAERGIWQKTGNIAIEVQSRNKPSGINVTEAEHWTQALMIEGLPFAYVTIPTPIIKTITQKTAMRNGTVPGGDDKSSRLVLVSFQQLFKEGPCLARHLFPTQGT